MAKKEITSGMGGVAIENQEAAGIPDSPIFRNTDRVERAVDERLLNAHVGGVPVRDLPLEMQLKLMYRQTDEGIAEANQGKSELRAETMVDEFTKGCEQRKDGILDRGMEPWEASNPLGDVANAHVSPGFKGKFLSPSKLDKEGTRGYRIVRHANGDPVKVRNMILGEMSQERVNARNKFFQDKAKNALGDAKQQYMKEGGQMSVDAEK